MSRAFVLLLSICCVALFNALLLAEQCDTVKGCDATGDDRYYKSRAQKIKYEKDIL